MAVRLQDGEAAMTSPILAELAYLTNPEPGKHILNIQFQGDDFAMPIQINNAQLAHMVADGAAALRGPRPKSFQARVLDWLMECFSAEVCRDRQERNHRFLEESLELVQSLGCTRSEAHQLVDYVFGREVGEPEQELGGVMVTLAALASCHDLNLNEAAETELARVWTKIDQIRAKQLAKPRHSPLP
jgi:hypothetical protein